MCKAHHWMINESRGTIAKAVCKNCGAKTEFANFIDEDALLINNRKWLFADENKERGRAKSSGKRKKTVVI